jgi:hypothetical protein
MIIATVGEQPVSLRRRATRDAVRTLRAHTLPACCQAGPGIGPFRNVS